MDYRAREMEQPCFEILSSARFGCLLTITPEWGHWFAGFVDGEGCFHASIPKGQITARFMLALRADDKGVLDNIKDTLGIGYINPKFYPKRGFNPQYCFIVSSYSELYHVLIPILSTFPLRSKKALELEVFSKLVAILYHKQHLRGRWNDVVELVSELKHLKEYQE